MQTTPITGHKDKIPHHAHLLIVHRRPKMVDGKPVLNKDGSFVMVEVDREEAHNLVLDAGSVHLAKQGYDTSGLSTNGFNFVALSDNATAPAVTDVAPFTGEITTGGLARAQGAVVLPIAPANDTTVKKVFTKTGSAATVQKCVLFNLGAAGIMNHEFQFTQRTLEVNDQLDVTITITLG